MIICKENKIQQKCLTITEYQLMGSSKYFFDVDTFKAPRHIMSIIVPPSK